MSGKEQSVRVRKRVEMPNLNDQQELKRDLDVRHTLFIGSDEKVLSSDFR